MKQININGRELVVVDVSPEVKYSHMVADIMFYTRNGREAYEDLGLGYNCNYLFRYSTATEEDFGKVGFDMDEGKYLALYRNMECFPNYFDTAKEALEYTLEQNNLPTTSDYIILEKVK